MNKETILNIGIFILILFGVLNIILYILQTPLTEPFYYSGEFPTSVDKPILSDTYDPHHSPGLSGLTKEQIYKKLPKPTNKFLCK